MCGDRYELQAGAKQIPEVQVSLFYAQVDDLLHVNVVMEANAS